MIASEKNLVSSIDKAYDLYFQMLRLVADVKDYAEERIELGRKKKLPTYADLHPNMSFVENAAVAQIEASEALNARLDKAGLGWSQYPELIKHLYGLMSESEYYKRYMQLPSRSYAADRTLVEDFYIETVQNNDMLETVVEEQSILWRDDIDFALIMVVRTLENSREKQDDLPIRREYKSEDDLSFTKELFRKTIVHFDEYQEYIEKFTTNWDVERIAFLDNIILACAMAEIVGFGSIPVKVTLDEYIEIAKYYSTPGSSLFINGVLDKIVESLRSEGRINKTGRGLVE
jgi:N utilization substance protein B